MESVIITGASGYLGANLSLYLAEKGIKVYAVTRRSSVDKIPIHENIECICCDLVNIRELPSMIDGSPDIFYHFGWDNAYSTAEDYKSQLVNVTYCCDAVYAAVEIGCNKFIYANTAMARSAVRYLSNDNVHPNVRSLYYMAKETANIMSKTLCALNNIGFIEASITNVYGPGLVKSSFFNYLLCNMINNTKCSLTSGNQYYDFIYVDDAMDAFFQIGENGKKFCSYYLGSDCPHTVREFVIRMKNILNSNSELCFGEITSESIGLDLSLFDIHSLERDFNFQYKYDFVKGVLSCKDYILNNCK